MSIDILNNGNELDGVNFSVGNLIRSEFKKDYIFYIELFLQGYLFRFKRFPRNINDLRYFSLYSSEGNSINFKRKL